LAEKKKGGTDDEVIVPLSKARMFYTFFFHYSHCSMTPSWEKHSAAFHQTDAKLTALHSIKVGLVEVSGLK
jgi:hypothetical protein